MSRFDLVAVVDWSASSAPPRPRPQADAIWLGIASAEGVRTTYLPGRRAAEVAIVDLIGAAQTRGQRLLVEFDFPMGYPAGFAGRLTGTHSAAAVWHWLSGQITDDAHNRNNRFAVADAINRHFGGAGPFWGRPESQPLPHLATSKTVDYESLGLAERRGVERLVPRAQPVWKLYTTGAAGGQSLTGLPLIHRLAALPGVSVWPFEAPGAMTLAEVYPSLLAPAVTQALTPGTIKDEVQVRLLSRSLWQLAQGDRLAALLAAPAAAARREEGWILGAGAESTLLAAL
jgi:molybdopterin-guanine dinucleotide biosynthesis protein B